MPDIEILSEKEMHAIEKARKLGIDPELLPAFMVPAEWADMDDGEVVMAFAEGNF